MRNTTDETVTGTEVAGASEPPADDPKLFAVPPLDPDPKEPARRGRKPDTRRSHSRKATSETAGTRASAGRPSNRDKRAKSVTQIHGMLSMPLEFIAPIAAKALEAQAEPIGDAWAAWAEHNVKVAKWLDGALDGAGALGVIAAYMPIAMAIYAEIAMRSMQQAPPVTVSSNGEGVIVPDAVFAGGEFVH